MIVTAPPPVAIGVPRRGWRERHGKLSAYDAGDEHFPSPVPHVPNRNVLKSTRLTLDAEVKQSGWVCLNGLRRFR